MKAAEVVIITGMSGAGKSQAIKCLEDIGFFCIDNLPTTLLPTFVRSAYNQNLQESGLRWSSMYVGASFWPRSSTS